jgi:hypothetical protein
MTAPGDISRIPGVERVISGIEFALATVPDFRIINSVALPVVPPALVIGPPRLSIRGYSYAGAGLTTAQFNIYVVVVMNQYAIDSLRTIIASVMNALERLTPGIVLSSVPGVYPSPGGSLPAYIVTYQIELR